MAKRDQTAAIAGTKLELYRLKYLNSETEAKIDKTQYGMLQRTQLGNLTIIRNTERNDHLNRPIWSDYTFILHTM